MPNQTTTKGWYNNITSARLEAQYNGTIFLRSTASATVFPLASTFSSTLGVTGALTLSGGLATSGSNITVIDDDLLGIGTGNTARISWDTTDANANELLIQLPAGGATDVPVIAIGQSIESVDLGLYNGVVDPVVAMFGVGAVTTGPTIEFRKARGTIAAPTVVTSGDDIGQIKAYGAVANGEYVQAASIEFDMAGTIATTRGPGTITFKTATDAAPSVLTTALTIGANQLVTVAAGLTATTGNVTLTAGSVALGEATLPAGTVNYIGRDNTGDTTINALTGKSINLAINGADIATLSATVLGFTGTIAATGARVTQSYHTNITSTNAVTVDSSETVKREITKYAKSALDVIKGMDIITFKHEKWLDDSDQTKLGIRAESVNEPLALSQIEREQGSYPGVNLYSLVALMAKAIQELTGEVATLKAAAV